MKMSLRDACNAPPVRHQNAEMTELCPLLLLWLGGSLASTYQPSTHVPIPIRNSAQLSFRLWISSLSPSLTPAI